MSMENYGYTVGNRTCDLPVCDAVPELTASRRALAVERVQCREKWKSGFCYHLI